MKINKKGRFTIEGYFNERHEFKFFLYHLKILSIIPLILIFLP